MQAFNIIKKFNDCTQSFHSVQSVILIGSFGRANPQPNSDIDYQLLVNNDFNNKEFKNFIKDSFDKNLKHFVYLPIKKKWCFYIGNEYQKLEIFIYHQYDELDKYYLGSEIDDIESSIVFDKTNNLKEYLQKITKRKKINIDKIQKEKIKHLINDFQNRFEDASSAHAKSDGYKFSVLFNHALNSLVRIIYLCEGEKQYDYMPPKFLDNFDLNQNWSKEEKLKIKELSSISIMCLRIANEHKKLLLSVFKKYLPLVIKKFNLPLNFKKINFS